jgi:hypothetical protein
MKCRGIYINNNSIVYYLYAESTAQGQLQTQHSAAIGNYIMGKHNIKSRVNYKETVMQKNKQTNGDGNNNICKQNKGIAKQ